MSTLPFLLSVADELDNLNSQTYMDDFGLGFHPHRHYYRNPNPSIQLSLPASTDWIEEKQRCRSHKFASVDHDNDDDDESQNNCDDEGNNDDADQNATTNHTSNRNSFTTNSNDQDNIDNTVHMYNLTKKCRKYNHGASTSQDITTPSSSSSFGVGFGGGIPKNSNLHLKMKPNKLQSQSLSCPSTSSSDESLQKTSMTLSSLASIEFLTCFPVKKNKTPKCSSTNSKKS
ncbi:uncharacterized protein LOC129947724 [Eupeodes corollae]|uniref:uncharacterized protein LOC129947724 n=1 Tax=Eupeodes corollae TaxID=290404 RepID=UPI00249123E7|nr:uncharacterized protein LOC129947724 [Eupeodes corollae]